MNKVKITRDWECEGALRIANPKTIKRYRELNQGMQNIDLHELHLFAAFDQKQFDEGKKAANIGEDEKVYRLCAGVFGTKEGILSYSKLCTEKENKVKTECDPQEVYVYEYNNHECMFGYDGDEPAIKIVIDIWGAEVAKTIERFDAIKSVEELIEEEA